MAGIVVKPRARILHGHDWVFSSEVLKIFGKPADGDIISLKDGKDHLIGSAIYNSKSQIVARRFSRRKQDLDLDFFKRRIGQAAEYRARRRVDPKLCRVVWSESDGLPGVIIDRYGEHFSLQTLTLAMDMRKEIIANAVVDLFESRASFQLANRQKASGTHAPLTIIERNDAPIRRAEGLELHSGVLRGDAPSQIEIEIGGLKFDVDLLHGQKTGFYLDPPSFTKTKSGLGDAMRGYRELHMRAFKLLSKDGLIATFSCSHHVSENGFMQMIAAALVDARCSARRLRRFEQAPDHPVLPTLPETEYFKGVLLEMMPAR